MKKNIVKYEKLLKELQAIRKEKENKFVRLFGQITFQQSQFIKEEINDIDIQIAVTKRKIKSLYSKKGNNE